jgi:hypothetical protein
MIQTTCRLQQQQQCCQQLAGTAVSGPTRQGLHAREWRISRTSSSNNSTRIDRAAELALLLLLLHACLLCLRTCRELPPAVCERAARVWLQGQPLPPRHPQLHVPGGTSVLVRSILQRLQVTCSAVQGKARFTAAPTALCARCEELKLHTTGIACSAVLATAALPRHPQLHVPGEPQGLVGGFEHCALGVCSSARESIFTAYYPKLQAPGRAGD